MNILPYVYAGLQIKKSNDWEIFLKNGSKKVSTTDILKICCNNFGLNTEDVQSKKRNIENVWAKHIFCYILKDYIPSNSSKPHTLCTIGYHINRNHATVLSSQRAAQNLIDSKDSEFISHLEEVKKILIERINN